MEDKIPEMELQRRASLARSIAYCDGLAAAHPELKDQMDAEREKLEKLLPPHLNFIEGRLQFSK